MQEDLAKQNATENWKVKKKKLSYLRLYVKESLKMVIL